MILDQEHKAQLSSVSDPVLRGAIEAFDEATNKLIERSKSYGTLSQVNDYFPTGDSGYYTMCHLKLLRAWNEVNAGRCPLDSLVDLLNYTAFWIGKMVAQDRKDLEEVPKIGQVILTAK